MDREEMNREEMDGLLNLGYTQKSSSESWSLELIWLQIIACYQNPHTLH